MVLLLYFPVAGQQSPLSAPVPHHSPLSLGLLLCPPGFFCSACYFYVTGWCSVTAFPRTFSGSLVFSACLFSPNISTKLLSLPLRPHWRVRILMVKFPCAKPFPDPHQPSAHAPQSLTGHTAPSRTRTLRFHSLLSQTVC